MRFAAQSCSSALGVGYTEIEFVDRNGSDDYCYDQEIKRTIHIAGEYERFMKIHQKIWNLSCGNREK